MPPRAPSTFFTFGAGANAKQYKQGSYGGLPAASTFQGFGSIQRRPSASFCPQTAWTGGSASRGGEQEKAGRFPLSLPCLRLRSVTTGAQAQGTEKLKTNQRVKAVRNCLAGASAPGWTW